MVKTAIPAPSENKIPKNKSSYCVLKRMLDVLFSFIAIIILSPFILIITLLIFLSDRGNPFFIQKRVGKDKKHFYIIKFRTMNTDTDANIPTHLLKDPDKFLTPMGRILRKASLDELPQLVNIFLGQMSFIGPRPALWNQYDLIAERDKWGANHVKPGLSGWAQINGRDELPIEIKARYDGEYAQNQSFLFDLKCFFGTFASVVTAKGVKEGIASSDKNRRPSDLNGGHIKYMYLTADPDQAKTVEVAGVDRIFLDLEILGKFERQGHLDTVVSHSSLDDVKKLRRVIKKSELLVRCNPVHQGLKPEIDRIINDGADIIMLPYFKTAEEVKCFLDCVDGRVPTVLLFETAEAVENIDEILSLEGITEVYIGLNDLHLSYNMKFMFELLADGTVERICNKFKEKGLPYGFGGIAKIGEGQLKSEYVIGEHKRLGSTCAILSRTFRNEVKGSRPVENMSREISLLRERENEVAQWSEKDFEENRRMVCSCVDEIVGKIRSVG